MGRRLISQRRGRGTPTYRFPKKGRQFTVKYRNVDGKVIDIVNTPVRNSPLARIRYTDGTEDYLISPKGLRVGDDTSFVSTLSKMPVGTRVFGIETSPFSGPKLCNSPGSSAVLASKSKEKCVIQLPSRREKVLSSECKASIGTPAASGFNEKPWTKAGKKWTAMHRKGKLYPRTSGVAMNAVDHPFGGPTSPGRSTTVSRHSPPGSKVGSWGSKRGSKNKKRGGNV